MALVVLVAALLAAPAAAEDSRSLLRSEGAAQAVEDRDLGMMKKKTKKKKMGL